MSKGTCSMRKSTSDTWNTCRYAARCLPHHVHRVRIYPVLRGTRCSENQQSVVARAQAGRRCRKHKKGKNAYGTQNFRCFQISPLDTIVQQSVAIAVLFIEQRAVTTPPVQFCVRFALQESAPARTRHAHAHTTRTHTHAQMTRA